MSKIKKVKDLESLVYNLELELKKTKLVLAELAGKKSKDAIDFSLKAAEIGKEGYEDDNLIIEGVFNGKLMIGPEGGFTDIEVEHARHHHFKPIRLGPRILRTETAAMTALAAIQYEFGDLNASNE